MSDDTFNRKSFRVGQGGYDVLTQSQDAEQEKAKEGRDDGRGEASASGNPKIHEGDELYDVLYRERAERMRTENIVSRSEQHNGSGFVAGLLLGAALAPARDQQTEQPEQFPTEARTEVTQPGAERQGRASVHALRVEQARATDTTQNVTAPNYDGPTPPSSGPASMEMEPSPAPLRIDAYGPEGPVGKIDAQGLGASQAAPQPVPSGLSDYVSEETAQKVYDRQQQPEKAQEREAPTRPDSGLSDYVSEDRFAKVQAEQRQRANSYGLSLG